MKKLTKSLLLATTILSAYSVFAEQIDHIHVKGNKRIEAPTIKSYFAPLIGKNFSAQKQSEVLKNLYATGLFSDIKLIQEGRNLTVTVSETGLIAKVEIKGNNKLKSNIITKEILTHAGSPLSQNEIERDVSKIQEMYKRAGRFAIQVNPTIETLPNNRVKVVFTIKEGPKTAIKYINFSGNQSYNASQLRSIIATKESAWFRFLDSSDTYDPDRIAYDEELIKQFYQSVGYADCRVLSTHAALSKTKEYFTITYVVEEGVLYNFGSVSLQNNIPTLDVEAIKKLLKIKEGDKFNANNLEKIDEAITDWLTHRGHPAVNVYHNIVKNPLTRQADVTFIIEPANKVYINHINITGNVKTQDNVIRREFKIAEGDILNYSYLDKAQRSLRNLNYFEKVVLKMVPTNQVGKYDVDLEVEEKSTAAVALEGGYNTAQGPFAGVSFHERNFAGTGRLLSLATQIMRKRSSYSFGLTDPYFMDKDLSLGFHLFHSASGSSTKANRWMGGDLQPYDLNTTGGRLTTGYELAEDVTHSVFYSLKKDHLSVKKNEIKSHLIQEQVGTYISSSVGHTLTYDRTDNIHMPKAGYMLSGSQEYSGLGGNNFYLKHELNTAAYHSFMNNQCTIKLAADLGKINGVGKHKVRISDRFNLGDQSLRGFAANGVGPRDKNTKEGLGGQKYYTATLEMQFPIGMPQEFNLSGAVFTDIGGLWGFDVRENSKYSKEDVYNSKAPKISAGVGLIWVTRIAPIRVDYAFPLKRKKGYDETQRFHVRFSAYF